MKRVNKKQTVLSVFLLALLVIAFVLSNNSGPSDLGMGAVNQHSALERYGVYFEEVSKDWGINFKHHGPQLDNQLNHIMPQISSVGASVSVVDYNNDGHQDIYLTNSARGTANALYKNMGNEVFKEVAKETGLAFMNTQEVGVSMHAVWADYDNDGFEDLFLTRWGKPALFHNDGGKKFTEVALGSEFPEWINANTAVWFDYNQDGLVDLFVGGYFHQSVNLWDLTNTQFMPESFEYAQNGGRKYLFENKGGGKFVEVSRETGLISNRWSYAAASVDLNEDGFPDLVIANDYGVDELFINRNGNTFIEAGGQTGIGFTPKSGMSVSFGDIMNRGEQAIYVSNISEPGVLIQGNNLWVPTAADESNLRYQNLAGSFGIEMGGWSYGAQFGDLNLDGYLDLYVANGYVSGEKGTDYWYDFSMVAGGNQSIIADAKNWPAMKGRSLSGYQKNKIWLNDGSGKFHEVADAIGGSLNFDSRSVALADLNSDGRIELLVASQKAPFKIYSSIVDSSKNWVAFHLEGTTSNRSAIGAEVLLFWNDHRQKQVIQSASGFSAQNQRPLHFGLGKEAEIEKAIIKWPSGITDTLWHPVSNTMHTIKEPEYE